MVFDKKKLGEEAASIGYEMGKLRDTITRDNDRAFTPEELATFDKMASDLKDKTAAIETAKRLEICNSIETKEFSRSEVERYKPNTVTKNEKELGFKAWALTAGGRQEKVTRSMTEAAHKCGYNLGTDTLTLPLVDNTRDITRNWGMEGSEISRNQSSSVDSQGGYLMNDGLFQGLERNLKWFGGARKVAKIIRTENGEPISFAYSDDTTNVGKRLGQDTTVSNTNVVYAKKTLGEYTYTSGVYPVSVQVLQDARIPISEDIGEVLGIRLGRVTNTDYTTGTGASMPYGFMTEATSGSTASSDSFVYKDLVAQLFSIDIAYRDSPNFYWTFADATMSYIWQLVDGNQRPLIWNQLQNLADGGQYKILDKPVVINNDIPSALTTGKTPVACGDFSKFIIRDVKEATVIALRERFMDQLAVGFMAYLRTDCKLLNTNAIKVMTLP